MSTSYKKQYYTAKAAYPEAIILFRVGDFYEVFLEDAILVAKILGLTLNSNNVGAFCGFPHHKLDSYLPQLIKSSKVAIVDDRNTISENKYHIVSSDGTECGEIFWYTSAEAKTSDIDLHRIAYIAANLRDALDTELSSVIEFRNERIEFFTDVARNTLQESHLQSCGEEILNKLTEKAIVTAREHILSLKAKFEVGESAWVLYNFKVNEAFVESVHVTNDGDIAYNIRFNDNFTEYDVKEDKLFYDIPSIIEYLQRENSKL